ncbi:MAG: phage major capsid protein, partial [Acidimicrobiales bacterium]
AVQAAENDAVSETNFDETTLAVSLQTIAGQQDVSRQALERGVGIDLVVFGDLASHYATVLDTSVYTAITGTAGIEAVTYTDASPTVAEFFPKLADAVQRVNSNRFMPATAIFMHPRRWGWLTAAVDSTNRPLIGLNAPSNAVGVGVAAEYGQVVGSLFGLPVVTDANMATNLGAGTNEDLVIVAKADDILLWEDGDGAPRELRFEQTNGGNLTVKLVAYGYSATTAGRYPKAIATVGGTGLVTPTF